MTDSADLVPVRRALLSVSDKSGLVEFATALSRRGVELVSTGGTARALSDAGLQVTPVESVTGFPEMMGGRVKTLHPSVHGALLALRDDPEHTDAMAAHGITPIDLVCVNLYPFERTVARGGTTDKEAIEQIDIGGPSMVRSAAKNHRSVAVVTDPAQYEAVMAELEGNDGATGFGLRRGLARAAFAATAAYDGAIARYFAAEAGAEFPENLVLSLTRSASLRYGENPHQPAAAYRDRAATAPSVLAAEQLCGKALSYNNLNDASAALELALAAERTSPGQVSAVVVKHTNPCGAALAGTVDDAVRLSIAGDPMAAFGGILACSATVDSDGADRIASEGSFFEVVVAPGFGPGAREILESRWKNCRLLAVGEIGRVGPVGLDLKFLPGGLLAQSRDVVVPDASLWTHSAGPTPQSDQLRAAPMLECVVRALSSNAVCIGGIADSGVGLFGAGAGQMDRVASCRLASEKAGDRAFGAVGCSDAFFPFPDGAAVLIDAGVSMIVHPGGSKRDDETFALCDERGVCCMTTGVRHFRH